jgi:glycosyltransferase involved in cell wall biosynthesis
VTALVNQHVSTRMDVLDFSSARVMQPWETEMHIVFGIERYWPASGGAETYVRRIAHELVKRHRVTVVCLFRDDCPITPMRRSLRLPSLSVVKDGRVRVVPLRIGIKERLSLIPVLIELLPCRISPSYYRRRAFTLGHSARVLLPSFLQVIHDADLIHTVAPWEMSHLARLASKEIRIPHIITGLMHPGYWADDSHSIALFRECDRVIALLESEKQLYAQAAISPLQIRVVGVPSPPIHCVAKTLFSDRYPMKGPVVLFLGVKRSYKGCDLLLEAAPLVWNRFPDARFIFIGPRSEESKHLFAGIVDDRIVELDRVSDDLKNSAISACSVLCLPSATEIMPNVILEAWMNQKPVIVSDIPPLAELVTGAGIVATRTPRAFADAIIRVLDQPKLAAHLGAVGQKKAEQDFSLSRIAQKLEEVYDEACSKTGIF